MTLGRNLFWLDCRHATLRGVSRGFILTGLVVTLVCSFARADGDDDAKNEPRAEIAAMAFVRENHPELATLLDQLKPMKPEEYRRAIRELAQVGKSLATLKTNNPRRYEAALETWKARSRVQLVVARLSNANAEATAELESQLRQSVQAQIDAEIRQARVDKEVVEERARRLGEALSRLESRRESAVETRVQSLLKQSRKKSKAKTSTNAGQPANPKKEPQP